MCNLIIKDSREKQSLREYGGTVVEACFSIVLILMFIFALIDFSRYLVIKASMEYGAHSAVDLAAKLPLLDDNSTSAASSADWATFEKSRNQVLAEAVRLPYAMLLKSPTDINSNNRLLSFVFNGANHPLEPKYGTTETAAILIRPGERYKCVASGTGCLNTPDYDHPTCPFPAVESISGTTSCDEANYDTTLATHPMIVELRAQFTFITPLPVNRTIEIRARAMAFREIRPNKQNGANAPVTIPSDQPTNTASYPTTPVPTVVPATPASTAPPPVSPAPTPTPAPACPSTTCDGIGVQLSSFPSCVCGCIPGRIEIQDTPIMICVENPD